MSGIAARLATERMSPSFDAGDEKLGSKSQNMKTIQECTVQQLCWSGELSAWFLSSRIRQALFHNWHGVQVPAAYSSWLCPCSLELTSFWM